MFVEFTRDQWRLHVRAFLRARDWLPARIDQSRALAEVLDGPFTLDRSAVRAAADDAHRRYRELGIVLRFVRPEWLAHALALTVLDDPTIEAPVLDGSLVRVPCYSDRSAREWAILHECAERLVGARCDHPDVQLVALALACESRSMRAAVAAHGAAGAAVALVRANAHLPPWVIAVSTLLETL